MLLTVRRRLELDKVRYGMSQPVEEVMVQVSAAWDQTKANETQINLNYTLMNVMWIGEREGALVLLQVM